MLEPLWAALGGGLDWIFWTAGFLSIITYVVPVLFQSLVLDKLENNLKKKYDAEWALVTGASSGIGRAIVEKLAQQEVNVVMVALDDQLLADSHADLCKMYPNLKFIKLGCNLGGGDYMTPIIEGTKDLNIQLVFNNAGFIVVGKHHEVAEGRSFANFECNATSPMKITRHFAKEMVDKKLRGLIAFTSSSAGFVPNPLSSLYASTKSFLTLFGTSVAAELRSSGVDVVVVHPSPIASNFFDGAGTLDVLMSFKKLAVGPSVIADVIFSSAGRFVVRDQGLVTILFRVVLKFVDFNFFCELVARTAHFSGDFNKDHSKKKA
eukprot:m.30989 g.30989  ORF g.30989 m.30989 type:complete len:321 (-) comp6875_c0_seq1:470-1432(-)